jgi:chemotaxis family two-component system response regulator Rcp1
MNILLIEDNSGDIRLIKEVFKESSLDDKLHVVTDGEQAISFLNKKDQWADAPKPNLIFLDLNLPKKDGREVLAEIKNDDELKFIPVVIFTSSEADQDIKKAYSLHANCYIVKPFDFDEYSRIISNIRDFWTNVVKLPGKYE